MSPSKWALAIAGVSALVLTSGCWCRAYDPETGTRLDGEYLNPRCSEVSVYVAPWPQLRQVGHTEIKYGWHSTPGGGLTYGPTGVGPVANDVPETYLFDIKPTVEEKMRGNGFSAGDSKLLAGYSIVCTDGILNQDSTGVGWWIWDVIVMLPSVCAPVPLQFRDDRDISVWVYDDKDRLVASRHVVYRRSIFALSAYAGIPADRNMQVKARVAANTACSIIADERQLGGDLEKIKSRLKENPSFISFKGCNGDTPLHWAAMQGRKDVVEFLLANKADINARNTSGQTPLHVAALSEQKEIVELLRENGGQE